jgi:phage replication-related protein YjqB (UPF0714/DUF867 family)
VRAKVTDGVDDVERCRLPEAALDATGVAAGQQVRLDHDGDPAVFTVEAADGKFAAVASGGRDRLGANGDSFRVEVDPVVVDPELDEATAAEAGGFLERCRTAGSTSVVALAPHGGHVEYGTDAQARRFADRLGATAWYCAGWWPGGGAFDRWHVTSTALHPASFPELDSLADRSFDRAVSFHGWTESYLAVGGGAPPSLREAVRDAVADVVGVDVRLAADPARAGTSPENVVNWLPAGGGVQLEQPHEVREERAEAVADAVAGVFEDR